MKNLKKLLAIFLSIAMVMCSTLPSFASENDAANETTESKIEEQLKEDLGEEHANEILNGESSEETSRGELEESDESSRGERLSEPAEEATEESESDYAEEPEEDETSTGEFDEPEETVVDETDATMVDEPEENVGASEENVGASEDFVGASSTSPEEESESTEETESTVGDDILLSHDETTESLSELKATKSEIVVEEKLLGAEPWMYWYLTDSDTTIHFSSTDPGSANPISNEIEVDYPMGLAKSKITAAVFDNEINAVTCQGFFDGFTMLGTITGIGNLKTNNVKYMTNMFYNCQSLPQLSLYGLDTANAEDMTNMFGNCQGLSGLELSTFNTYKVRTMNKMFENCESLDYLDLRNFDTSSVTTMASMFKNCKKLLDLTLSSNFTTAEVTDMESMFESCEKLNNPDLSSFNTSKVTNMKSMFKGCSGLVKLDLTGFNTSNVYYMKEFLSGCSNIKTIDLNNFDTENVREMEKMFYGCSSLMTIIASDKFSTINVSDDGVDMFSLCGRLVGCYGTEAGTSGVYNKGYAHIDEGISNRGYFSSAPWMYWYLTDSNQTIHYTSSKPTSGDYEIMTRRDRVIYNGLNKASITKAEFDNNITAVACDEFFSGFSSMVDIVNLNKLDTQNVNSMRSMFVDCSQLVDLDLSNFRTSNVTSMGHMFYNCSSLTSLDLNKFDTSNVENTQNMFYGCSLLTKIIVSNSFVTTSVTTLHNNMFAGCTNLVGGAGTRYDGGHTDKVYARIDRPGLGEPGYFTRAPWMYWYLTNSDTTIHFSSTDPGGANPISSEIEVDYPMGLAKSNIDFAVFDNEINAVTCKGFFAGFTRLSEIRGPGTLKTNNVKDMTNMFYNCQGLMTLSIYWDTSNVEDMTNMFGNCQSLDALGFYKFDTSKVKTMNNMFENCEDLDYVDLSKFDTSSVTTMASMFKNCKTLDNLILSSNFTTAEVTDMESMFESCERLNNPDLSSFNTSKVTNMKSMFKGCSGLVKLDLTGFDTSNVELMEKMFYNCSSLLTIIASDKFSTINVSDDGEDMFDGCSLVGCYGTNAKTTIVYNKGYARIDSSSNNGYFSSAPWMYWYLTDSNQTIHYTNSKPTSGNYEIMTRRDGIVYNGLGITDIGAITKAEFDNNITAATCDEFFASFSSMNDIVGLNKLNTQNVNSMRSMFAGCSQLDSLDLSNFNTSNVTKMDFMFYNCSSLTSLDLNKFDTSNVTNTQYMFHGCSSLTKIIVSNSFVTTSVTMHDNMFANCTKLVGGAGTRYDGGHTNKDYARIDGGPASAAPGYFTLYVPPTPPAPYYPGGSSGSRGSSGGGGGGGGPVTEDAPAVTYLPYVKSIIAFASNLTSKWSQDAMSSKWKLSVTAENGSEMNLKNGFVLYTHISTQIVGNTSVQTAANNTYVFDENGNMITGWVHTADGKIYFFENKKTSDEGKMIIGWKQIQGSWYCFGPDGEMYKDTITPDGHPVGPDGKWRG